MSSIVVGVILCRLTTLQHGSQAQEELENKNELKGKKRVGAEGESRRKRQERWVEEEEEWEEEDNRKKKEGGSKEGGKEKKMAPRPLSFVNEEARVARMSIGLSG